MMNSLTRSLLWIALHWRTSAVIAGAVGIAATCRWCLETDEVRDQRAQRRNKKELRALADKISTYGRNEAGYLDSMETKVCTDNLLVLGKEGQRELQQHGWNVDLRKEIPKDLAHHMGVVDTRIAIERGLEDMPGLQLRYFYAYWELGRFGWSYPIIPEAIFSIRNAFTAQAALEFDRKTEMLGVFAQKLQQYRLLMPRHPMTTVIVVAEKSKDTLRLQQGLEQVGSRIPLLIVALEELKQRGLVAVPQPRSHMVGTRTIYEQLEIDLARLQSEEQLIKDG